MPRGLSQERAQRIWDAAYGAAYVSVRSRMVTEGRWSDGLESYASVAHCAALTASEAVEGLRERQRRERKRR